MNHVRRPPPTAPQLEALQGRVALALAARLTESAESLPPDIGERLRFGRERALAVARERRAERQAAEQAVAVTPAGHAAHVVLQGGPTPWWLRLASVLPLVLLIAGLLGIQHLHDAEQIAAAAEIDSALLADELPPDAYGDPGFGEFLRVQDTAR